MGIYNKKHLIFDFDGTIVDSLDLLVKIYNQICHNYSCLPVDIKDKEELRKLKSQEVLKRYKINFFKIPFLLLKVRANFKSRISEVKIFDGISNVLRELKSNDFDLYILTSNSKENVTFFLKSNNLLDVFTSVYSSSNVFGKDKSIKRFLKSENIKKEECIYIGDETRDIEAMKRINMPIISVSWGFNSREALLKLNPDEVVDKPSDLLSLFSGNKL